MSRRLFALPILVLAALALVAGGSPADAEVSVRRMVAEPGMPSPAARTCDIRFRAHTPVITSCQHSCYVEAWDGPVLMAANTCTETVWASFVFAADDGRTWRTPCYELIPGADAVAIPEANISPWAERRVVVAQEPGGLGYVNASPGAACPASREVQPSTVGQ